MMNFSKSLSKTFVVSQKVTYKDKATGATMGNAVKAFKN